VASSVLDASGLLAYLQGERGSEQVRDAIGEGAAISAANWAEVLSKLVEAGEDAVTLAGRLEREGLIDDAVKVVPLTAEDALAIAQLRQATRAAGLSLGDRACLALGRRLGLPVLTTDRAWNDLALTGITVRAIR
jgi:ribonuclease VapC